MISHLRLRYLLEDNNVDPDKYKILNDGQILMENQVYWDILSEINSRLNEIEKTLKERK